MNKDRNWTILFIGGASGVGKSSIAYRLAQFYNVNVMEADDVYLAVKAVTTKENLPAVHFWDTGLNWMDFGVKGNVDWLINVSKEIAPSLKAIVEDHLETGVPVIIEGDFIHPEITTSFNNPKVKSFFVSERDKNQIAQNFIAREGGELQNFRADVSLRYNEWLLDTCKNLNIEVVESRPWETVLNRVIEII